MLMVLRGPTAAPNDHLGLRLGGLSRSLPPLGRGAPLPQERMALFLCFGVLPQALTFRKDGRGGGEERKHGPGSGA